MMASPPSTPEQCPDENALASFASGTLSGANASSVEAHLDGCADCRALVAAVAAERSSPDARDVLTRLDTGVPTRLDTGAQESAALPEAPPLRPGAVLSRYVISRVLGAGGMGVVYAAEDPRLGRKVALKLLRSVKAEAVGERQARLLREAQAMARLSHPNVLPVFDLGTEEGQVFLAMELVEGPTLAEWLRQRERPWREVLGLFLKAGRGLAAAHRAGLVHRDFKPANVLVGADGRPRVTDFGLVRLGAAWEEPAAEAPSGGSEPALTQAGAVPGTPAYMSPEQLAGRPVDARSDQFSFCVALHEALYGLRPFEAEAPPERRWTPRRPERGPRLPGRIKAALARGLALAPADRFPSMDALLEVLAKPSALRGRGWALGLAAGLALTAVGVGAWRELQGTLVVGGQLPVLLMEDETTTLEVAGISRVAVSDPTIVDIVVDGDSMHLVGLRAGATPLIVWTEKKVRYNFLVTVKAKGTAPHAPGNSW